MFGQEKEPRPMTGEEIAFEKLTKQVEKLEKIVGALAVTNFLTQHEDGDEEVREQSVEAVNVWSAEYKQQWKTDKEIEALETQKHELDMKISNLKLRARMGAGGLIGGSTFATKNIALQQERMNAFNVSAARAEAVGVLKGVK